MLNLMESNWEDIQTAFSQYSNEEQDELLDHFNAAIEDLGDNLFGSDANFSDLRTFIVGCDEENQKKFLEAVNEALILDGP